MNKQELLEEIVKLDIEVSENFPHYDLVGKEVVLDLIDQLEEPEKIVIPQFVADWIELAKEVGLSLVGVMDLDTITIHKTYPKVEFQKLKDYMIYGKNQKKVARAWLDGYTTEKEKLYRVRAGKSYVRFNLDGSIVGAKAVNSVVTLDHLSNLPFDYQKAIESGIITLVEVTNDLREETT